MTHQLVLPGAALPPGVTAPPVASVVPGAATPAPIAVHFGDDGIVEVTLPVNAVVRSHEAKAAASAVREFSAGRKVPLLLTVTGVLAITTDARASYGNPLAISACALLGESPVDRVIAHFLLRAKPESLPAQFFTSEAEAREWLKEHDGES
ncbi:hypothetical protein [Arthrobacter sp. NyZ413]|uniref:DUF7793 family protein n=1 Tax=Arthrobacter sp. NyZ413 TaxID=3144669 RepID=UPI002CEA2113|nr:hypothetical protein [Arthrobacter sp.]